MANDIKSIFEQLKKIWHLQYLMVNYYTDVPVPVSTSVALHIQRMPTLMITMMYTDFLDNHITTYW